MKAVFIDRDDTIIVDTPDYCVDSKEKIKFFPETMKALERVSKLDYLVFIITNQEVISAGRLSHENFQDIHEEILRRLAQSGIKITETYVCPHTANDKCDCRKPKPGMLLRAAAEHNIDLRNSWMIGDRQTDVMAGEAAGTQTILVRTAQIPQQDVTAGYTAQNILDAINHIAAKAKLSL